MMYEKALRIALHKQASALRRRMDDRLRTSGHGHGYAEPDETVVEYDEDAQAEIDRNDDFA